MVNFCIHSHLLIILLAVGCGAPISMNRDMSKPVISQDDEALAGAFASLDGTWEGTFIIYHLPDASTVKRPADDAVGLELLRSLPLEEKGRVKVRQNYRSENPFFQTVTIEDRYNENGVEQLVESHGVNKVEDGHLWCVVEKPDERVIHLGRLDGKHTIIWSRYINNPSRLEYFRETVGPEAYDIVGYGYYEGDDRRDGPSTWFHGLYHRVTDP